MISKAEEKGKLAVQYQLECNLAHAEFYKSTNKAYHKYGKTIDKAEAKLQKIINPAIDRRNARLDKASEDYHRALDLLENEP